MLLILYKDFKLIYKLLEETCGKSEIRTEVSDNFDGYSNDKNGNKIIYSVAPDQLLDNSANLEPLHVDLDAELVTQFL